MAEGGGSGLCSQELLDSKISRSLYEVKREMVLFTCSVAYYLRIFIFFYEDCRIIFLSKVCQACILVVLL